MPRKVWIPLALVALGIIVGLGLIFGPKLAAKALGGLVAVEATRRGAARTIKRNRKAQGDADASDNIARVGRSETLADTVSVPTADAGAVADAATEELRRLGL